jgi:hypothetical protein
MFHKIFQKISLDLNLGLLLLLLFLIMYFVVVCHVSTFVFALSVTNGCSGKGHEDILGFA